MNGIIPTVFMILAGMAAVSHYIEGYPFNVWIWPINTFIWCFIATYLS